MKSFAKYLVLPVVLSTAVTVSAQQTGTNAEKPLTSSEMALRVATYDKQVEDDTKQVLHLQAIARKAKDVVKLTCVNDVLVEFKAQRNRFEAARTSFGEAVGEGGAARGSFDEITTTSGEIKKLRGDAEACVGVGDLYKQESATLVTHPDFLDDPTGEDPFEVTVEPPVYASPFG